MMMIGGLKMDWIAMRPWEKGTWSRVDDVCWFHCMDWLYGIFWSRRMTMYWIWQRCFLHVVYGVVWYNGGQLCQRFFQHHCKRVCGNMSYGVTWFWWSDFFHQIFTGQEAFLFQDVSRWFLSPCVEARCIGRWQLIDGIGHRARVWRDERRDQKSGTFQDWKDYQWNRTTDQLNSCDPEGWICYGPCRVGSHNTWLHDVTYGFLNMVYI